MPQTRLLDATSTPIDWSECLSEITNATLLGLDCETQDEARHEGLNSYNTAVRHVFDHRRTTMTGFSIYADGSDNAWYINLAHADVENRVPFDQARCLIDAVPDDCLVIAHNAPFELVMFKQCHDVDLKNMVCSLQLAVTHHGPDEYTFQKLCAAELTGFRRIAGDVVSAFRSCDTKNLNSEQRELLGKFIAKESEAAHSYNGFIDTICHSYSLKDLTLSHFGVKQMTFKEVLNGKAHMGELTGAEVAAYGADDAYWAVEHYKWMYADLLATNPAALVTFFETENPMVQVYADCWREGLQLNMDEVYVQRGNERAGMAAELRTLKALIKSLLPFAEEPVERLVEKQDWYAKGWEKKRAQIVAWANSADSDDDFEQCFQTSNPIGNSWAAEQGLAVPKAGKLNLIYYHAMRTIVYDLLGHRIVYDTGAVSSDKDARGKIYETFEAEGEVVKLGVMKSLQAMADIEQRMKLFITPYTQLMDPETGCVYPTLSSMLATRRLAGRNPNGMQLAKRGEAAYIRGFFLADNEDSLLVSADWSSIELVLIGELSGDPEFAKVFGQLPYGDLHTGAAVDCLKVDPNYAWLTEEEFTNELKLGRNPHNRVLKDFNGNELAPAKWVKFMRTEVGKACNFNYFYSGALSTIGDKLGWSSDTMWDAVDRYRSRFSVAEEWRLGVGNKGVEQGFVTLPDGHRRVRLEATGGWNQVMKTKFTDLSPSQAMQDYADLACRRIASRSKNQLVNAMIQGTCATLAKRSILKIKELIKDAGLDNLVRFLIPIHDELLFSVHHSVVEQFIPILRKGMCEHPNLVTSLPLHCTVAIGRTFKPYDAQNPAYSQIELDEAPVIEQVISKDFEGKSLPDEMLPGLIDWMMAA
jgi:DNA polymerase I-like protein with 3'-5' exonuclease and polymerase domains